MAANRTQPGRTTHGMSYTPEHVAWLSMRSRCYRTTDRRYKDYGGRGIRVCGRWLESFQNFFADVGLRPSPKHSIDRIDVNGNYEPGNVRWATAEEQQRNRTDSRLLTAHGETFCMSEWAERLGVPCATIGGRLDRGWSVERAVTEPPLPKNKTCRAAGDAIVSADVVEAANRNGINAPTLLGRIRRGWDQLRAATEPVHTQHRRKQWPVQ